MENETDEKYGKYGIDDFSDDEEVSDGSPGDVDPQIVESIEDFSDLV